MEKGNSNLSIFVVIVEVKRSQKTFRLLVIHSQTLVGSNAEKESEINPSITTNELMGVGFSSIQYYLTLFLSYWQKLLGERLCVQTIERTRSERFKK
jgi:hypothetical protein